MKYRKTVEKAIELINRGDLLNAQKVYTSVLKKDPTNTHALNNLAAIYLQQGNYERCIFLSNKSLRLDGNQPEAANNLGCGLLGQVEMGSALSYFNMAIRLKSDYPEPYNNLCTIYTDEGRFGDALEAANKCLSLRPGFVDAIINRGSLFKAMGDDERALNDYQWAQKLSPDHAIASYNEALILLHRFEFTVGWRKYQNRFLALGIKRPEFATTLPEWCPKLDTGEPVRVAIWAEQGIGDELFYAGYLNQVGRECDEIKLTITVDRRLKKLYERSFPRWNIVDKREALSSQDFDAHLPLGGLGASFTPDLNLLKRNIHGYLRVDDVRSYDYRSRLVVPGQRLVGLSWRSAREGSGPKKSIPLDELSFLGKLKDTVFVNLQYGDTAAEQRLFQEITGCAMMTIEELDIFNDIDGLAALTHACDAVITISNITAHIAGALGKCTFLLASHSEALLWYWHDIGGKSPWYPNTEILRQKTYRDWNSVIHDLQARLLCWLDEPASGGNTLHD